MAGFTLLKHSVKLGETSSDAAVTHKTVGLAAHLGAAKADASTLDEKKAPLKAMLDAVEEMVDAEGVASSDSTLPDVAAPVIAVSAKAGLGVTATDVVQLSAGEKVSLMSGRDTQFLTGAGLRTHIWQAIGCWPGR